MTSISAVIITKNEEKNIARAIESCLDLCEEIIIVDSGSTDKTCEIARSYPKVKLFESEWLGFSNTKNLGNEKASGDYLLSLDADEAISEELKREILDMKDKLNGLYRIPRLTNYCGQWIHHCGWRPDYQSRLFPKSKARWNQTEVHEKLLYDDLEVKKLKGDLLHYSYYTLSDHIKRIEPYTELGAKNVLQKKSRFLLLQGVIRSEFRFVRTYFLKLGFLDGKYGFIISILSAYVVFIKYAKAYMMQKNSNK